MSQQNESGLKAFTATEALEAFRRVKLTAGSGTAVEYADAGEEFVGLTQNKVALGGVVTVALRSAARSYKATAAGAVVVGATLYGANDGKVDDAASGNAIGTALEAASGDDSIFEILLDNASAAQTTTDFGDTGIKSDVIAESTAATGVTIDGVLLKDGAVTGNLTGNVTGNVNGAVTGNVTGNVVLPAATVAAAGNDQAGAAAVATGFTLVSGADAAKGVKLPAAGAGKLCIIKNADAANAVLKVYPNTDDAINALEANASLDIAAKTAVLLVAYDATTWYSLPLLPS